MILFILTLLSFVAFYLSVLAFVRFVGVWAQDHEEWDDEVFPNGNKPDFSHKKYYIAGGVILAIAWVLGFVKIMMLNIFLLRTNTVLHNRMIRRVFRATVEFFDTNPVGRILNRFSSDLGILDKSNPLTAADVLDGTIYTIVMLITTSIINPWVLIPIFFALIALTRIKKLFKQSVLASKKIELASRSPIYSFLSSTTFGLISIRVFHQGANFLKEFMRLIYDSSRAILNNHRLNNLFGLALDMVIAFLFILGAVLFIIIAFTSSIQSSLFGLAFLGFLEIGEMGSWVIRQTLYLDINMQSAERIMEYCELPQEPPLEAKEVDRKLTVEKKWPSHGKISFKNVFMRYKKDANYAIQGLTFDIAPKEKVAVVGRTGAGKSSILQCLFRMREIEERPDSYILIDDQNIKEVGLTLLRSNISIIPQTPVVFTGSIRRNLSPLNEHSEEKLWQVLEEVNLKSYVEKLEHKLDTDMTVSNTVFSAGQKQLICLARAILKNCKIIVLDEATANVDHETDEFIQNKVVEKFGDSTVITIAHRLSTIAHYDKVIVMDKGQAAEIGHPYRLLVEREGDQEITNVNGIFAQMVLKTGPDMARRIFTIAQGTYSALAKNLGTI